MTDADVDARLNALLREPPPPPDARFAERIVALAAYDQQRVAARRRGLRLVAGEAAALVAALGTFTLLARLPAGGAGAIIPLASPAMLGVAILALWALVGARESAPV